MNKIESLLKSIEENTQLTNEYFSVRAFIVAIVEITLYHPEVAREWINSLFPNQSVSDKEKK